MVESFVRRQSGAQLTGFVYMFCRKVICIIDNPDMFVAIRIVSYTVYRFVQKAESIITLSVNIKLDFISVLPVYDISD